MSGQIAHPRALSSHSRCNAECLPDCGPHVLRVAAGGSLEYGQGDQQRVSLRIPLRFAPGPRHTLRTKPSSMLFERPCFASHGRRVWRICACVCLMASVPSRSCRCALLVIFRMCLMPDGRGQLWPCTRNCRRNACGGAGRLADPSQTGAILAWLAWSCRIAFVAVLSGASANSSQIRRSPPSI